MNKLNNGLAMSITWLLVMQPWLTATAKAPSAAKHNQTTAERPIAPTSVPAARELSGFFDDRTAELRALRDATHEPGFAEDGSPEMRSPLIDLPIVDAALSERIDRGQADETIRVIVYLDYLPHADVFADVTRTHDKDIDELDADRATFAERQKALRAADGKIDAENYSSQFTMSAVDTQALRAINERHESLSFAIKEETTSQLRMLIDASQAPLKGAIKNLGGNVEFSTIAGNMIIATMTPGAIEKLAGEPGVLRIVEDGIMEGHLTNADRSTMVDPADAGLLGLWDAGADGGIYDPAIIDSGIDLGHPGMTDNAARSNFSSWYVVAGVGSSSYNESCCTIDDLQGHGTHVAGIVGSYGTGAYPGHLGISHGVEKLVSLKAGWLNTAGRASMFWSDKYNLVDRALYNTNGLSPANSFADDVDGMNLSYGGSTTLDDTDGGRFWDSVIATYPDLPVTISAGNSGPSNTIFNDPATSYNAITVAAADDRDTSSLTDDIIASYSSRGPTASGRKKPDIAAPGTDISAPNTFWETQADYVDKDGTSMAAPMVLGVVMDLMDAGVFDEKVIKAILINTAQKNHPSMNIESDSDGWDEAIGWGYMNAYAAYHHRFDYFIDSVQPRLSGSDEYHLYKGTMQDEGSAGEGRDRATMVWNRPATYNTAAAPTTYYNLSDLNIRLYDESDNFLIDSDLDGNDNVQQVRVGAGAGPTDVVINAYAWSSAFASGATAETFALATEEGFTRVDHPTTFQGIAIWPTSIEPNETFDVEFWLRNDSELASHNNTFDLQLPAGWTLISGSDVQTVGSAAGGGGNTAHVNYTIRAGTVLGAATIQVAHSHNSYNVPYGNFNWNMSTTVEWDNMPPNPDPMSFSTLPFDIGTGDISMTASVASDGAHNPVQYYLDYTSSPTGGTGGSDSGWQSSRSYTDAFLSVNHEYCYRAWAQDSASFPNLTTPSAIDCTYTAIETPTGVTIGSVGTTFVVASSASVPSNLTLASSALKLRNVTAGTDSGWNQNNNAWTSSGLTPASGYSFDARARNGDGDQTSNSPSTLVYTLANFPAVDALVTVSDSEIKVALNPNGNGNQAEYFIQNTTNGTDSGWINMTSHSFESLDCESTYNFQANARNGDGVETIVVPLGFQTTAACTGGADTDGDGVTDNDDNCQLVSNPTQLDTNGDGIGNHCDADITDDCLVNFGDLAAVKAGFFPVNDPNADFTGDGLVNFADLSFLKSVFLLPPGPGAPGNICD